MSKTETTLAALSHLDAMAESWAAEVGLPAMALSISCRKDAADRQRGIEALVQQAFTEGAYRLYLKAKDDGMLKDACNE